MRLKFLIILSLFFTKTCLSQSKVHTENFKLDSLKKNEKEFAEINSRFFEFSKSATKVRIIETCSTTPTLCGVFAFGSSSLVIIESGKYKGDTIIIAASCKSTNYTINKTYYLKISTAPNFDVMLCNNKSYSPNWNFNLVNNKHLLYFGTLKKALN